MNPQQRYSHDVGKVALFVPNEAYGMSASQLGRIAHDMRPLGIDTLVVKFADGTGRWYSNYQDVVDKYDACTSNGVGMVPFAFDYGYGAGQRNNAQVDGECDILTELTEFIAHARNGEGFVMADLESAWNGQVQAAERFAHNMNGKPGLLALTTWADPNQQNWQGVARALVPVVNAWVPQAYNAWLDANLWEDRALGELNIQPALDLSQEFGPNDPVANARVARAGDASTVYLWTLSQVNAHRNQLQQIVQTMHS